MKKISKPTTKEKNKKLKKSDNLFTKNTISLDDPKNEKYLDDFAYKVYLINLNSESGDNDEN
ncbi:MAG: hypothetical protein J6K45_02210 [Clostridia bacterium]|nr:hypothetical protein [Clostridia bacterium]MBP3503412.1 hypothetical protein [Clostridia bacterium]